METIHLRVNNEIELAQLHEKDAEAIFALVEKNRASLEMWLPWAPKTKTVEDERKFLRSLDEDRGRTGEIVFGIFIDSKISGAIGINHINKEANFAELGYWLDAEAHGKGVMTEAVKRLLDYCFNDLSLNRVGIYASTSNVKSRAVIERVGCSFEGNLRDYIRIGDIYQDASMYSMLAREFKKSI